MPSIEPDEGGGKMDGAEEVAGALVIACSDAAILLALVEHIRMNRSTNLHDKLATITGFKLATITGFKLAAHSQIKRASP